MRGLLVASFLVGCGAAAGATPPSVAPPSVAPPQPATTTRVVAAPRTPVDLGGPVATIRVVQPPDGAHVSDCVFTLVSGQFTSWRCDATPSSTSFPLQAVAAERLLPALAAVDDWGARLGDGDDGETDAPITITLADHRSMTRFGAAADREPPARTAFRLAAMAAAQEGLAIVRERAEACTSCPDDAYCEEDWHCATTGPRDKNCVRVAGCERRLPPTSRCLHHYQCQSRRCEGETETVGHCG